MRTKHLLGALTLLACTRDPKGPPSPAQQPAASEQALPDTTANPSRTLEAELTYAPKVPHRPFREHPAKVVVNLEVNEVEKEICAAACATRSGRSAARCRASSSACARATWSRSTSRTTRRTRCRTTSTCTRSPVRAAARRARSPRPATSRSSRSARLQPGLYVYHCATAPVPHARRERHVRPDPRRAARGPAAGRPRVLRHAGRASTPPASTTSRACRRSTCRRASTRSRRTSCSTAPKARSTGDKALTAKVGETVRIFFGNGGPNLDVELPRDRRDLRPASIPKAARIAQENVQTTLVPAGGATIVEMHSRTCPARTRSSTTRCSARSTRAPSASCVVDGPSRARSDERQKQKPTSRTRERPTSCRNPPVKTDRSAIRRSSSARRRSRTSAPRAISRLVRALPGQFPPLAKSRLPRERAEGEDHRPRPARPAGPVTVNGMTYNGVMPPMAFLSDDEIAGGADLRARFLRQQARRRSQPGEVAKVRGAK